MGRRILVQSYFISTVGRHGNEEVIRQYVKQQGSEKTIRSSTVKTSRWSFLRVSVFGLLPQLAAGSLHSLRTVSCVYRHRAFSRLEPFGSLLGKEALPLGGGWPLQHDGFLGQNQRNGLRERYQWVARHLTNLLHIWLYRREREIPRYTP